MEICRSIQVKLINPFDESTPPRICLAGQPGNRVIVSLNTPAILRDFSDRVDPSAQKLPEGCSVICVSWKATSDPNNSDGLPPRLFSWNMVDGHISPLICRVYMDAEVGTSFPCKRGASSRVPYRLPLRGNDHRTRMRCVSATGCITRSRDIKLNWISEAERTPRPLHCMVRCTSNSASQQKRRPQISPRGRRQSKDAWQR